MVIGRRDPQPRSGPSPPSGGRLVAVRTGQVRFSQPTISRSTHLVGEPISVVGLAQACADHGYVSDPIEVVLMPDGKLTSLDNRRLWASRKAGLETVPARVWYSEDLLPAPRRRVFTPEVDIVDHLGRLGGRATLLVRAGVPARTMCEAVLVRCGDRDRPRHSPAFPVVGTFRAPMVTGAAVHTDDRRAVREALARGSRHNPTASVVASEPGTPRRRDPTRTGREGFTR